MIILPRTYATVPDLYLRYERSKGLLWYCLLLQFRTRKRKIYYLLMIFNLLPMNIPINYLNRKRLISKEYATTNKSILILTPSNLYRLFCLSLYRNNRYNIKMRLKDLAKFTGEKESALKQFNTDIKGIVSIKEYYLPTAHSIYTIRKNRYNLPDLETHFITLSKEFTQVNVPIKIKGYYIKLLLIAENNIISLPNSK